MIYAIVCFQRNNIAAVPRDLIYHTVFLINSNSTVGNFPWLFIAKIHLYYCDSVRAVPGLCIRDASYSRVARILSVARKVKGSKHL